MNKSIQEKIYEADLCRMCVGNRLFRQQCELRIDSLHFTFSSMREIVDGRFSELEFICSINDLSTLLHFHNADSDIDSDSDIDLDDERFSDYVEGLNYCMAIRISPTEENHLLSFVESGEYTSEDKFQKATTKTRNFPNGFCTFEFFTSSDLCSAISRLHQLQPRRIPQSLLSIFCKFLVEDSEERKKYRQLQFTSSLKSSQRNLVRYPFKLSIEQDMKISKEYPYFHPNIDINLQNSSSTTSVYWCNDTILTRESHQRLITYSTQRGYDYLDDCLIKFMLHRFHRLFISTGIVKSTIILDSLFYEQLTNKHHAKSVDRYFIPKGIDIFQYKYILVPVNFSLHWFFMVVVNPGLIFSKTTNEPNEEISCIIYIDSLKHTQKALEKHGSNIRSWLSREYNRSSQIGDKSFKIDEKTLKIYDPRVSRQENGYDCGLYMIKFISSFLELVGEDVNFTQEDKVDNFFRAISTNPKFHVLPEHISVAAKNGNESTMRFQMYDMIHSMSKMCPTTIASGELDDAARSQPRKSNLKITSSEDLSKPEQQSSIAVRDHNSSKPPKTTRPKVQQKSLPLSIGQHISSAYPKKDMLNASNKATNTTTFTAAADMYPPAPPPAALIMPFDRDMGQQSAMEWTNRAPSIVANDLATYSPSLVAAPPLPPAALIMPFDRDMGQQSAMEWTNRAPSIVANDLATYSPSLVAAAIILDLDDDHVHKVMTLTPDQLLRLPPDEQQSVLALRAHIAKVAEEIKYTKKTKRSIRKKLANMLDATPEVASRTKTATKRQPHNPTRTSVAKVALINEMKDKANTDADRQKNKNTLAMDIDLGISGNSDDLFTPPQSFNTPSYHSYLKSSMPSRNSGSAPGLTLDDDYVHKVMALTPDQLLRLPPDEQQSVLALRAQIAKVAEEIKYTKTTTRGISPFDQETGKKLANMLDASPEVASRTKTATKRQPQNPTRTSVAKVALINEMKDKANTDADRQKNKNTLAMDIDLGISGNSDDLFTPPQSFNTPSYHSYLKSSMPSRNSGSAPELTVQEQTVAIPVTDPLISDQIILLRTVLTLDTFQKIFKNDHAFGIGTQSKAKGKNRVKSNTFTIIFDYTGLRSTECTMDQLITYAKLATVLEYSDKKDRLSTLDEQNFDPCAKFTWMHDVAEGEDMDAEEESILSDLEELVPDFVCITDIEEAITMQEEDIPYISSNKNRKSVEINEEQVHGVVWSSNEVLEAPKEPEEKMSDMPAMLKHNHGYRFQTPIESFLSFVPATWFKKITYESNRYALRKYDNQGVGYSKFKICGMNFKRLRVREILQFHGILFKMMLHKETGRSYESYWRSPQSFCFTKYMSLKRFQQIRSVLAFNSHEITTRTDGKKDALHKVRPILNILKAVLGMYIKLGSDVSLDEASFACRSSYGRSLIFYNPKKPSGKFHFRAYCICCPETNLMVGIRFATRDNFETVLPAHMKRIVNQSNLNTGDSYSEDGFSYTSSTDDDENSHDLETNAYPASKGNNKIDEIVKDMCSILPAGITVNLDNYYTSIASAIELRKRKIYVRGTLRSNRKFLPTKVLLTRKEATLSTRGFRKVAVAKEEGIVAFSWLDTKPVVMLSTADGTTESSGVKRREKDKRNMIPAPKCLQLYNKKMGGVDRHDEIRSTFSVHERHTFRRWYVQLYLCLLDVASANAKLCYGLKNPQLQKKNKEWGAEFFEKISDMLISDETDWGKYFGTTDECSEYLGMHDEDDKRQHDLDLLFDRSPLKKRKLIEQVEPATSVVLEEKCIPTIKVTRDGSDRGRCCQICRFELRPNTVKDVYYCPTHKVRLCAVMKSQPNYNELPFVCKDEGFERLTCWEKAHAFYLRGANCIFSEPPKDGAPTDCCREKRKHPLVVARNQFQSNLINLQVKGRDIHKTEDYIRHINDSIDEEGQYREESYDEHEAHFYDDKEKDNEKDNINELKKKNNEIVGWRNIFRKW